MKYNDGIIKTKGLKQKRGKRKGYPLIRWLLIGSLLIQSGFTVLPQDVETLDLVTQGSRTRRNTMAHRCYKQSPIK